MFNGMKALRLAVVALSMIAFFASPAHAAEVGDAAPSFALPTLEGNVNLEQLRGRWVYVDFWASWCAPCKQSFPFMNAMRAKFRDRALEIVAINVDAKRADADRFLRQVPAEFSIAFDPAGETAKRFAVKSMPSAYLIDPKGRVRMVHRGFKSADAEAIEREIANAIAKG
jgi:cytochrome c biogenesis protein CcmG, thiol:disulfide interchange protein DsbE